MPTKPQGEVQENVRLKGLILKLSDTLEEAADVIGTYAPGFELLLNQIEQLQEEIKKINAH